MNNKEAVAHVKQKIEEYVIATKMVPVKLEVPAEVFGSLLVNNDFDLITTQFNNGNTYYYKGVKIIIDPRAPNPRSDTVKVHKDELYALCQEVLDIPDIPDSLYIRAKQMDQKYRGQ